MKKVAVLWTGGKDSYLALRLAQESGCEIVGLVTFVPSDGREFQAHPQSEMRLQAEKMNLPIYFLKVSEPYENSYVSGLNWVKNTLGVCAVITGDIDLVDGAPNWILECCKNIEMEVIRPLWEKPREFIMESLLSRGIQAKISWINSPLIPKTWLNQVIDLNLLSEMKALSLKTGIDLAGENGEYHTMVVL